MECVDGNGLDIPFNERQEEEKITEMHPESPPKAADENTNSGGETRGYIIPPLWAPCGTQTNGCGDKEQPSSAAQSLLDFAAEIPEETNAWKKSSRRATSISLKRSTFLQPLRVLLH